MKTTIPFFLATALVASSSFSQTANEPATRPSGPAGQPTSSPAYGQQQPTGSGQYQTQTGGANASFTNAAGQTFTVDQLATDLRNLNDAVAKTMPALTAFNDAFSSSGAHQNLAGTISNLVSGALNRNSNQNSSQSSQGNATVNALQARLRGTGSNPNLTQDLSKLRNDLQPVAPLLQDLLGTTAGSEPSPDQVISGPRGTNAYQRPITPTGR